MVLLEYHLAPGGKLQKTLGCLKYLSRLGKLTMKVTPDEDEAFLWDE